MKKLTALALSVFVLSGCLATNPPAPVGDKVMWSSHASKPDWTMAPSPTLKSIEGDIVKTLREEKYYEFTGLSQRHGSERISREMAVADASANAVRYARQLIEKSLSTAINSESSETSSSDGSVVIQDEIKVEAIGILENMAIKDLYIEQWKSGAKIFFKTYALIQIPSEDISRIRTNSME